MANLFRCSQAGVSYVNAQQAITIATLFVVVLVGSARLYVCSHHTKRFVVALKDEDEETYRSLMASDLTWRTLDIVGG